jgi:hypothetical protein
MRDLGIGASSHRTLEWITMRQLHPRTRTWKNIRRTLSVACMSVLLWPGAWVTFAEEGPTAAPPAAKPEAAPAAQPSARTEGAAATQPTAQPDAAADKSTEKLSPEQLEALVAPIALYPDDLLTQSLVASTYPLEIIQLQQWLAKHKDLKDKALIDAVAKEPWDPAIQSMAGIPEVVSRLANDIQWTTDLGNAFLAQQADVMDAVQRMRKKAQDKGALKTNEQQKVETKVVEEKTVIVVESANPQVIYVPSYSPVVVYGPPVYYPYPPIYYPPYPPGAAFVTFGIGVMWGAAWGGACCHYGWGGSNVNINVNNNFNQINHNQGGNRGQGGGNWSHNPQHRGAAPYGDKATASKYGGSSRGQSPGSGQASARQQPSGGGGRGASAGAGTMDRGAAGGAGSAGVSDRSAGGGRGGAAGPSTADRGGSGGAGNRGGGDSIGNRSIPSSGSSRGSSGFSGGSGGYSGSSARASSSRGSSSMGSRGGGGRGGGGRGGRR